MTPRHTILLVEDEQEPAEMMARFLEMHDYEVLLAREGEKAIELIDAHAGRIHLALLDIMVPGMDGKEICHRIRNHPVIGEIPVIFLTARDREQDEIEGLELGADDYISKPASLKLVKARIESLLRRQDPRTSNWIRYGELYLDRAAREFYHNRQRLDLTSTEYAIAELFFKHPKRVWSRQEILDNLSGEDRLVFDRTVDVHIKNLRLKLGNASGIIKTYRGVGYGLNREEAGV